MKRINLLFTAVVLFACNSNVWAQDWPQYLGPNRNSTSTQKSILRTWPASGPEILWTVNVGPGYGGPVIKDSKVYLLDRDDKTGDIMRCFDFSSGKELWKFSYDAPGSVMFPGSRSVPAVDGNYVYSCGHNGDLYCINITTHKPVWNKNIWTDFGGTKLPIWAITQCPLIYGDLVIVSAQAPDAGENRVLVVGGYEHGVVMIKVEKKADGNYGVTELFKHNDFGDHTKPPIFHNGYFYAQFTTNSRRDGLVCMGMDGKVMWKTLRAPLFDKGSMILADGLILATDGRTTLYLIEPSPSGFKPLASAEVLKEGGISGDDPLASRVGGSTQNWAPMALAGGKLLIRDQNRLLCVRIAK